MRTFLVAVVALAVIAVLIVDGLAMYSGHRIAVEVAEGAAEQAAQAYVATHGSEAAAEKVVEGITEEAGVQLVSAICGSGNSRWYQVTVRVEPDTHVLGHLPYVRDLLWQESTSVVHF